jgi:hypothetical protein
MSHNEPGNQLHEWETRWTEQDELLEDDPAGALPAACDFVEQVLNESEASVSVGGENDELLGGYQAARDTAERVERGEDVDPGDIGAAIENLRAVYESLRSGRQT